MTRFPVVRDVFERVYSTFGLAVIAAWVSSGLSWQESFTFDSLRTYVGAGVLAVFTLLKGLAATQVAKARGQATSASLDPKVQLQPTGNDRPVVND